MATEIRPPTPIRRPIKATTGIPDTADKTIPAQKRIKPEVIIVGSASLVALATLSARELFPR